MDNRPFLFAVLFFLSNVVLSQEQNLLEKELPDLAFGNILNYNKSEAKLSDYRHQIVILDFWATWCAPCLKSFPHLEALQSKFEGNLQVFAVTSSDTEERIKKFLTKKKTTLPIVIDDGKALSSQFPHRIIPHTVIIDKTGKVKAVTTPEKINAEIIAKILNGETIAINEKKDNLEFNPQNNLSGESALFQFTLTPYQEGPTMMMPFRNGRLFIHNADLKWLYEITQEFSSSVRTIWEADQEKYKWGKENAYCIEIIAPHKTKKQILQFLLDHLHNNFGLKSKVEMRKTKVKILKRTTEPLKLDKIDHESESTQGGGMSGSGIFIPKGSISVIAQYLESFGIVKIPVIDETGLTENYRIEIPFYEEDPDNIYEELNKVGLQLEDAERDIEMLILYEVDTTRND